MNHYDEKLVIAKMPVRGHDVLCSVLFDRNGLPEDFRLDSGDERPKPGDIYVGHVESVQNSSGGAFIRIGKRITAYLPDIPGRMRKYLLRKSPGDGPLKPGEELLVQVDNEALKTKLPRVSGILKIPGRYLVLTTDGPGIGFSKNLNRDEQKEIREWIRGLPGTAGSRYGMIVRTESRNADPESFCREYKALREALEEICEYGLQRSLYSQIRSGSSGWEYLAVRMPEDQSEIVTDVPEIQEKLLRLDGTAKPRIYSDPLLPLYKLYGFEKILEHLTNRIVWLKSGASIVIDQTEAFVVIDVNSGKRLRKKKSESSHLEINLEAAAQIFREIRLRELSGTILIDFINMKDPKEEEFLLNEVRSLAGRDPRKIRVVDITPLGICEMTREKKDASVRQRLMELEKDRNDSVSK